MILGRLFTALFEAGVVVVATSNVAPDDLYKDGLNRALFLPFVALLRERLDIVELDARTDYRLEKLVARAGLLYAAQPQGRRGARRRLPRADRGRARRSRPRSNCSAALSTCRRPSDGVARFDFDELCRRPLGSADYLEIAERFHTVLIDRIPVMGPSERNEARRFITLIDALYDMRVKLIASAAAEPEALFAGADGTEGVRIRAHRLAPVRDAFGRLSRAAAWQRDRIAGGRSRRHRRDLSADAPARRAERSASRRHRPGACAQVRPCADDGRRRRRGRRHDPRQCLPLFPVEDGAARRGRGERAEAARGAPARGGRRRRSGARQARAHADRGSSRLSRQARRRPGPVRSP